MNLQAYESNERNLTTQLFNQSALPINKVSYTTGRIAYDAIATLNNNQTILIEIKVRNCYIDTYPNLFLQKDKLMSLIKYRDRFNNNYIWYVNHFNHHIDDSKKDFIIFNLHRRIEEWRSNPPIIEQRLMNAETCRSNEDKMYKDVILLQYNEKIDRKGTYSIN